MVFLGGSGIMAVTGNSILTVLVSFRHSNAFVTDFIFNLAPMLVAVVEIHSCCNPHIFTWVGLPSSKSDKTGCIPHLQACVCVCVEGLHSELLNVKYFKSQVTIRNNPKTFFFFPWLLDDTKAAAIIVIIIIMSCSVCFDTLQWCLLVNIFPPPRPWSRYCISLTLWLSTLCSAPHLESVPSALLGCHVISRCELAINFKLFKLYRPRFLIHLSRTQEWKRLTARKACSSELPP